MREAGLELRVGLDFFRSGWSRLFDRLLCFGDDWLRVGVQSKVANDDDAGS